MNFHKIEKVTQEERDGFVENSMMENCTLDGEEAIIKGRLLPYAEVINEYGRTSFSWQAVRRIMAKGGDFES